MSLNKYLNDNKVELFFLIYKIFNLAFMNRWGHCLLNFVGVFCIHSVSLRIISI